MGPDNPEDITLKDLLGLMRESDAGHAMIVFRGDETPESIRSVVFAVEGRMARHVVAMLEAFQAALGEPVEGGV